MPKYLSISQINMATRCGEQYRRRYIEGQIVPPGIALVQGTACHKAREHVMSKRLATGTLCPVGEAQEAASVALKERWNEGVIIDGAFEGMSDKQAQGAAEDQAVDLSTLDYTHNLVDTIPVAVEERVELVHASLPLPLVGVIDLRDDKKMIRDLKTAGKTPSQNDADTSPQLTMYAMLHRLVKGEQESGLQLDCLVKTKTPKAVNLQTSRDNDDIQVLLNRIARVVEMIDKGVFLPAPTDAWACSLKFCGFASTCPYFAGKKRPTT